MTVYDYDALALVATAIKTANYTAAANELVPCNATSAPFTVTLPTAPPDRTNVVVKKIDSSTNAVTFACGGSDVFNVASGPTSGTLPLQYQAVRLQYNSASAIWYVISTDAPLSQLDSRYLNQNTTGTAAGITGKTTPTGALVGTTDTQALTNKDLSGAGLTWPTNLAAFNAKTAPAGAVVGTTDTQTLTNKNLTDPTNTIPSPTVFAPADYGWKAWTFDPMFNSTSMASANGFICVSQVPIRSSMTISNIILYIASAGATLTSGQNFVALYDPSGNLLSATADQSSNWTSTGLKTMALTTPQAVTPGLYYVAYLWNGTTQPKPASSSAIVPGNGGNSGPTLRAAYDSTHPSQTSMRSALALTALTIYFWAAVS